MVQILSKIKVQYNKKFYPQLEERVYEKIEEFEVSDDFAKIIYNLLKEYTKKNEEIE